MVTVAKAGPPPELQALEEGEHILTIEEVTVDLENKFKDKVNPVLRLTWKTTEGNTFQSSVGISLFPGNGERPPAKLLDMLQKLGIAITTDEDGNRDFNEKALVGRTVKAFVEKTASGWPKVSKVLRAADGTVGAAEAAVTNALGTE